MGTTCVIHNSLHVIGCVLCEQLLSTSQHLFLSYIRSFSSLPLLLLLWTHLLPHPLRPPRGCAGHPASHAYNQPRPLGARYLENCSIKTTRQWHLAGMRQTLVTPNPQPKVRSPVGPREASSCTTPDYVYMYTWRILAMQPPQWYTYTLGGCPVPFRLL